MARLLPETSRTFLVRSTSRPCPQQSPPLCLWCSQSLFSHPVLLTLASSCHFPVCRHTHGLSARWSSTGPSACASSPYFCLPTSRGSQPPRHQPPTPTPPPHTIMDAQLMPVSPMSIAAKQKQESRFHSEMYRATKLGLEEKHKQECAESTFLHLPSLKMWAVIHSINSIWNRYPYMEQGGCFPSGSAGRDPICQCRRHKRLNLWVRKITSSRKWQSTSVLLPGKSLGQRSLVGYSPWGLKEPDMTEHTHIQNR